METLLKYALAGALGIAAISHLRRSGLEHIPTVGYSNWFLSFITAFKFFPHGQLLIQEGYDKFPASPFKVAMIDRFMVVVSGRTLVEELRKAPEDILSFDGATNETAQVSEIMGHSIIDNAYHASVVRGALTRNLAVIAPAVCEEVRLAFDAALSAGNDVGDGWMSVPGHESVMRVVSQVSNRVFVGAPLCRNERFQQLNVEFTMEFMKTAFLISSFPPFIRPTMKKFIPSVPNQVKEAVAFLEPTIRERKRLIEEFGSNHPDKQQDMLSWLLDHEEGRQATIEDLSKRILMVNFAAIHTSSMAFTHALFHLAAMPEYAQPLREEVEQAVNEEGWTKAASSKMRKLDSFIRESIRLNGIGCFSMTRKVMVPFTFSDGTYLPVGTMVSAAASSTHRDDSVYADANGFDGFRFSKLGDQPGAGTRHRLVATSPEFVAFGHGIHACPGRFFASQELIAMLAHVVVTFDVKLVDDGPRPANQWIAFAQMPNSTARVLFKRR